MHYVARVNGLLQDVLFQKDLLAQVDELVEYLKDEEPEAQLAALQQALQDPRKWSEILGAGQSEAEVRQFFVALASALQALMAQQ